MPKLILLVGMIASGKSTYARQLAARGAMVVSEDDVTLMLHGGDYRGWDKGVKGVYNAVTETVITEGLRAGRSVVVDRVHMKPARRQRHIALGQAAGAQVYAVCFPIEDPAVHAWRRCSHDGRGYSREQWTQVAQRHLDSYVPPTLAEGFKALLTPKALFDLC